ncbi:hypothetical protein H6A66_03820 [Bacteroides caecigallinarum]|uniref:hypothetical protein n=1 Tax=Bacteroides caecigallinarum TaxID=1411144 RepID=UPI0019595AD2|nr:hypothetical protein [Bacteroides caecigallinarum]MBM6864306.1 hypothetical protein [Bacteroides caecigallinarum]
MTKINILFLSLVLAIITVACGGSSVPESVTLKVTQSEVYGDNSEYFSVVQGEYKLKCNDRVRMKIRLRLEKAPEKEINYIHSPSLRLKDEDGMSIVDSYSQMVLADGEEEKMVSFLKSEPGTEQDFVFINDFDYDYAKSVMEKSKSFSIENIYISFKEDEKGSSADMEDIEKGLNTLGKTMDLMDDVMKNSDEMMETSRKAMELLKEYSE